MSTMSCLHLHKFAVHLLVRRVQCCLAARKHGHAGKSSPKTNRCTGCGCLSSQLRAQAIDPPTGRTTSIDNINSGWMRHLLFNGKQRSAQFTTTIQVDGLNLFDSYFARFFASGEKFQSRGARRRGEAAMNLGKNYQVVLQSRPGVNGEPVDENFQCKECPLPGSLSKGQLLVQTLCLSVDPALRCRMNESTGVEYMGPWELGKVVEGFGGVGLVLDSLSPDFSPGDLVTTAGFWPWVLYHVMSPKKDPQLRKIPAEMDVLRKQPSLVLSGLGLTGLTAYLGVVEKGHITPGSQQTVVVSAAAGSTGSLAGQIAKLLGCGKLIGVCGSDAKCTMLTSDLGFDHAINYKTEDMAARLREYCPAGVDVYFDNVGGDTSNAVIRQMNPGSHVILCGQIAAYNKDLPYPPPIPKEIQKILTERNITRERFLVLAYQEKFPAALQALTQWLLEGKLKVKETVAEGLENAGKAFVSMMRGGNTGKQIVQVSSPSQQPKS